MMNESKRRSNPTLEIDDLTSLAAVHEYSAPEALLAFAIERFPKIAIALSGAESAVLVDMAVKIKSDIGVFTLDTGRLHEETYRFIDAIREKYRIEVDVLFPNQALVEAMVRRKGLYSFYEDGHEECCRIRKVEPLKRKLASLDAWISGQRREQSPTRSSIRVLERDLTFGTQEHPLVIVNPLATWNVARVWSYIRANRVPYNELYERGYQSIGCAPCTRAVLPGDHERSGRWWWESADKKECGILAGNLKRNS